MKCLRVAGSDASQSCKKCLEKGIQCTPVPPKGKKTIKRSGARLELAKALYGEATANDASSSTSLSCVSIAPTAVSSRLNTSEVEGLLILSLLEEFFNGLVTEPLVDPIPLSRVFNRAGRRFDQLDDDAQVLCAAIVAHVSRSTDHPLIVGAGAPTKLHRGELVRKGYDLTSYGHRRESACATLLGKALEAVDSKGIFRKIPSVESVAALVLLEGVVAHSDHDPLAPLSRPFGQAYTGHVKYLLELGSADKRIAGNVLGYTCWMRQGLASAQTGRSHSFSEDDYLLLRAPCWSPPTLASISNETSCEISDSGQLFKSLLDAYVYHLAMTLAETPQRLTGLRARTTVRIDENYCHHFLQRLSEAKTVTPILLARANAYRDAPNPAKVHYHTRALRLGRCIMCFILYEAIKKRIKWESEEGNKVQVIDDYDRGYKMRLGLLEEKCREVAFEAARELVEMFEESIQAGEQIESSGWMDASGHEWIFSTFSSWARLIVEAPTSEEGGPTNFPLSTKLSNLITLQRTLISVSWSYPKYAEWLPWIGEEIEKNQLTREEDDWSQSIVFPSGSEGENSDVIGCQK